MRPGAPTRLLVIAGLLALCGCSKPASTPDATSSSGNAAALSGGSSASAPSTADNAGAAPTPAPKPRIVVHAGKELSVMVNQQISSKTSNPGDRFEGSLAAPVMVGEKKVIPSGARVIGTVTDAKSAGKFNGNAAITVTLESIRVNGERYPIKTTSVTQAGKGRGKRTGIGAGGGAVVGGIFGAIAGGGKGAAIGVGAGAGAGAAGAGFTGDREIEISPETRLSFTLENTIAISGN